MPRHLTLRFAAPVLAALACALLTAAPSGAAYVPTAQDADVNQDNFVNVLDLVAISKNVSSRADVNRDGQVNSLDYQAVARFFGTSLLRDKYKQPFSSDSIWNMPIGSGAKYAYANFWLSTSYSIIDEDTWVTTTAADPVREIIDDRNFWDGPRCSSTDPSGVMTAFPDSLLVPDATPNYRPNRAAAILQPDGRTIVQVNALARCDVGGPVFGIYHYTVDIYGQGIKGGAGGSGLSSIGGTIRKGELLPGGAIKHVMKVNVTCAVYCSPAVGPGGGPGWRWPAITSDAHCGSYACGYGGAIPTIQMGSLVALPPLLTETSITAPGMTWPAGMETDVGKKLFHAFQDYGAYIVDDAVWGGTAYAIHVERGVEDEVSQQYGISMDGALQSYGGATGAYWRDYHRIWLNLRVINNNSATTTGGGGTPRVPLAPAIGN
jgi:hypothetical protein